MSARTPQRYDCAGPKHPWEHCDGCYHMEPHPRGDYVHWDDYDSLRALNAELLAAVEKYAACPACGLAKCPKGEGCPECADLRALIARARGEQT